MAIASSFGLKVNLGKAKFMAVGVDVSLEDRCPLRVDGGEIEHVSEFRYPGSIISTDGRCHHDIKSRISSAHVQWVLYVDQCSLIPISLFLLNLSFFRHAQLPCYCMALSAGYR